MCQCAGEPLPHPVQGPVVPRPNLLRGKANGLADLGVAAALLRVFNQNQTGLVAKPFQSLPGPREERGLGRSRAGFAIARPIAGLDPGRSEGLTVKGQIGVSLQPPHDIHRLVSRNDRIDQKSEGTRGVL